MELINELIHDLENIVKGNETVILPRYKTKEGIRVVNKTFSRADEQTQEDVLNSQYLLEGGLRGINPIRKQYPGSFSEEDDTQKGARLDAYRIKELDPQDGTTDFKETYQSNT